MSNGYPQALDTKMHARGSRRGDILAKLEADMSQRSPLSRETYPFFGILAKVRFHPSFQVLRDHSEKRASAEIGSLSALKVTSKSVEELC